jgi:membrane-bound lytic murein transglycosylase A
MAKNNDILHAIREMWHFNEFTSGIQTRPASWLFAVALALLPGCKSPPPQEPVAEPAPTLAPEAPPVAAPAPAPPPAVQPAPVPGVAKPPSISDVATGSALRQAAWSELPAWPEDDPARAWGAVIESCGALANHVAWRETCALAAQVTDPDRETARRFFETHFRPYQVIGADGAREGLITGYYEPLLHGSLRPSERYRYPLYGVPDDLLAIDLGEFSPELKDLRLRGRLEGRRVVPYYDRAQIESGKAAVRGREIAWVADPIELFFLQIQGSGRIKLEDGRMLRIGYADHNGHPYRSIGRWLVERGELPFEKASMQGIKAWARDNQGRLTELLNFNTRYVFFRELPGHLPGPLGALGVPLTAQRSIAVDPRYVPLGAPVYVATTWPNSNRPLNRLMLAQDTGSAIRGAVRADFFWGFGEVAAREAGRMRQGLRMWVLLPNGHPLSGEAKGDR